MIESSVRVCDSDTTVRICRSGNPAVIAWRRLQRFNARVDRLLSATLREHGTNRAQFDVMLTIGANEGLTQQDLADSIGLTRANISQLLDRLQTAGYIERTPRGRAYALHLTEQGRELLEITIPVLDQVIIDQFATISPTDQTVLDALIDQLDLCDHTSK